jgi:hypothetical protein
VYVFDLCERKEWIQSENLGKMGINPKTQNVAERQKVSQKPGKPRARTFR